ncbi:3-ketoacyl-CoA synthase [Vigna angularis]|uniref:3-ketoacyl-CoA synthase n=1 Tax=Phaseolus angularis TaxID=3914 RepID=A0A8T0JMF7_PHAAN|nr:3-ketoacyl-CoA synthase [Vigna angularis]
MPHFSNSVKLKYVKLGYQYLVNHIITFIIIPLMLATFIELLRLGPDEILKLWNSLHLHLVQILSSSFLLIIIATIYFMSKPRTVFLVDYACFKPPVTCRVPFATFMEHSRLILKNNPKSVEFQMRILERSGLGEETCLPPAIHYIPPKPTMEAARGEAELVIFSAMDSLFKKTGLKPKDIDILIVNCSLFSPTPSLLVHVVRTHKGSDDKAFRCVFEEEDKEGKVGISLSKDLMAIAGEALKSNITTMGPLVLPASEQLLFLFTLIGRKIFNPRWKPYIPDFKQAFEHFCIHAGGRAVIDELQKNLQLSAEHVEASRMTLHRTIETPLDGPWSDCIHRYPVHIPEIVKL